MRFKNITNTYKNRFGPLEYTPGWTDYAKQSNCIRLMNSVYFPTNIIKQ